MTATRGNGRHNNCNGRHDNGNGQQDDRRHDNGDGRHDSCKTYCSCALGKWICKYYHEGHVAAELRRVEH